MSSAKGEKTIEPNSVDGQPIYSEDSAFVGTYVWLTYPAEEVDSVKTEVEVFARASSTLSAASISPLGVDFRRLSDHLKRSARRRLSNS